MSILPKKPRVLLLGAEPGGDIPNKIRHSLGPNFEVETHLGIQTVTDEPADLAFVVFSSTKFDKDVRSQISVLKSSHRSPPIIVIAGEISTDEILDLLMNGVADFVTPPLSRDTILPRALRLIGQNQTISTAERVVHKFALKQFIGHNKNVARLFAMVENIAKCDATVLISGETGTGKELFARSIHYLSPRSGKPFVPVNCGALPLELMENELFGHERGAYTNAVTSEDGLIDEAQRGTLFLDEIDAFPLQAQVKLLRFLQEKEYRAVGSRRVKRADVRVIAALNASPSESVRLGKLRQDLYYRLNVISFKLPPLRERTEDIPALTQHFIEKYSLEFHKACSGVTPGAMALLMQYEWPGNIRELEHVVERGIILSQTEWIQPDDILIPAGSNACTESFRAAKTALVADFERDYIRKLLHTYNGNISRAAEAAKKNRRAFWQLMRKHRIGVDEFKT